MAAAELRKRRSATNPLGTNLDAFQDYSLEWPLIDMFKRSRPWVSGVDDGVWFDNRTVSVDENGWVRKLEPGQVARTLLFWTDGSEHPLGDYVVTYEGDGDIQFWNSGTVVSSTPGRQILRVTDSKVGIAIFLRRTNPKNPLRNIHVYLPGGVCTNDGAKPCRVDLECGAGYCASLDSVKTRLYHPDFLKGLQPYGVIRFMNWMFTNNSTEQSWADRPKMTDARWTEHGVPVEAMVELTNELGADPWFTLPHRADDGYVRAFAEYVRDHSKSRRVYVELSNEVWNSQFQQAAHAEAEGVRLKLSPNAFEARLRWYSRRAVQIFRIFEEVFGGKERLVRVLGSQAANAWVSETVLSFEEASRHADALAVAPYLGGDLGTSESPVDTAALSLDALMAELAGPAVARAAKSMSEQAAMAKKYGVKLVAYEGGQHLVGVGGRENDEKLNSLFDAANRDGRMKGVYLRYLREWRARGGELFVHYTSFGGYSKWGRWGALEHVDQPRNLAPKFDALVTFAEENPLPAPR